jgi:GNAT superfamily N-acetyltransferase
MEGAASASTLAASVTTSRPLREYVGMEIRRARFSDAEVEPLLAGLSQEYDTRYGENVEMTRASADEFDPPSGLFIVLMDGPITVGGGGFRRYDATTCEVKRMWTHPLYRRRGLAARVLKALEDAAREAGYTRLILETGPRQPEAEALYARRGYNRTEFYGHYPEARAFSLDLSRL